MTLVMNKCTDFVMDEGQVRPMTKSMASHVNNLWWDTITDDWILDEETSDYNCNIVNLYSLEEITRNDK